MGRPKRSGMQFVRICHTNTHTILYISKSLWKAMGEPERLDIQRLDGKLCLMRLGRGESANRKPRGTTTISGCDRIGTAQASATRPTGWVA